MDPHALLTVVILSAIGLCSCQNGLQLHGPLYGAVGGNMVFKLITPPSQPPVTITWRHERGQIVNLAGGGNPVTGPGYRDRFSLNSSTASLELRNLNFTDNGEYILSIITDDDGGGEGKTLLTVLERISNVSASADKYKLVEFNSSVILTCSASGTSPSFQWLNRSADVIESDRVLLSPDNKNLTILNVTRYDNGPYQCKATNNISVGMSLDVTLTIYYGPDSAVLTVTPEKPAHNLGSVITLSCTSESSPAAQFKWALNGTLLGREGPELKLENIQASQSGAYSCWAYNSMTQRYKPSSPKTITVVGCPTDKEKNSISVGAIAGIGVACLLFGVAVGVGGSFLAMRKNSILSKSKRIKGSSDRFYETPLPPIPGAPDQPYATVIENPNSRATAADSRCSHVYENAKRLK